MDGFDQYISATGADTWLHGPQRDGMYWIERTRESESS